MNDQPLQGRTALVTGSTGGIGQAIAERLAAEGASVAITGLGDPQPALAAVSAHGGRVEMIEADLLERGEAARLVSEAQRRFERLDILVLNAGMQHVCPIEEFPDDRWNMIVELNLSSNFHAIKAAVPGMKARGWGRLIAIASAHGLVASPNKSAYIASKHGQVGLMKAVAVELAQTAITANAICPGYVNTPLVQGQIADQARATGLSEDRVVDEIILASQPSKRFVQPEHVAALAAFLCSEAGCSVTGAALSMDGGWTAR